jgi:2-polyprenyl-6-methoxyphenol hydroxylase-like FAD-dependent oxidoreductase
MEPTAVDVCIIGGGLTGLAAACAFRQTGASVLVIERRTELGDIHRGDWLRPSAVALLKKWGASLERHAPIEIRSVEVEIGPRVVASRRFRKEPGLCLPHTQLEAVLREAAKSAGVELRLGWQLQSLAYGGNQGRVAGVTAVCGVDAGGFMAKLVIGADGRSSAVREALGLNYRAVDKVNEVIAVEAELSGGGATVPSRIVYSIGRLGGGVAAPFAHRRMRVVATAALGEADTLARKTAGVLAQELPARSPLPMGSSVDPTRIRGYELTNTGHAANYAKRGAVCIGDAVHAAPVPSGEGMQMALLDVEALVRHVGPALKEGDRAIEKALVRFETERWPENERRMRRTRKALRWLAPLSGAKLLLARSPLAGSFLSSLLSID